MHQSDIDEAVESALREFCAGGMYRRYVGDHSAQLCEQLAQQWAACNVQLTSSGTAAVELALRAAGVEQGHEVLISAYDYPGNFWAIERVGAKPVLIDIEAQGWLLHPNFLDWLRSETESALPRAIIVSHLHGQLQDIAELREWCDTVGMFLIEDACQAVGAHVDGRPVGSLGHASILSFGGSKVLSSGRGGALLTSDATIAQRAKICAGAGSGPFTMSEVQSAILLAQLPWLENINAQCRAYFGELAQCLQQTSNVIAPYAGFIGQTSFYQAGFVLATAATDPDENVTADSKLLRLIERLQSLAIPAGAGFPGFHRRSARRCRQLQPLGQVAQTASHTLTIHHSIALRGSVTANQLAHIIMEQLNF